MSIGYNNVMRSETDKLLEKVLKLPLEARAAIAGSLLESLDETVDEDTEASWADEIARRVRDLDAGKAKTIPWSQARRMILGG
jgi:putative addiction module component (TIGR02574 family)